jgi:tRNA pseudouridine38-40 synthase
MARTFLVTLHYDGGRFAGWQRQAKGRTVQAEIEAILEQLCARPIRVHAAGRTDAGVHAVGMATSCTLPDRWSPSTLRRSLNSLLPEDCWAESVQEAKAGFHARTKAVSRQYRYVIGTDSTAASPFRRRYEWALGKPLDRDALNASAALLTGDLDFGAFSVRRSPVTHRRCRLRMAGWVERRGHAGVVFEIAADRFLHHMVRMLVGTMVDIGRGRRAVSDMTRLLALDPAVRTSPPAPAEGLFFVAAEYPAEWLA